MENENNLENKQTGLFGNMSKDEIEGFTKIGNTIIDAIEKNKASDEKFQNKLNADVKKINSRDVQIYTNGFQTGLHEGKNSGFWEGVGKTLAIEAIMGLGYAAYLYNKNKNS